MRPTFLLVGDEQSMLLGSCQPSSDADLHNPMAVQWGQNVYGSAQRWCTPYAGSTRWDSFTLKVSRVGGGVLGVLGGSVCHDVSLL